MSKVGDMLTATVTGAAAAKYEWAVSLDGEEWSVIDSETDETFDVTADLVGMYVKVTVTAEDGETASDVTLSQVAEADGQIEITSAEATAVNVIKVLLAESVNIDDTNVTLTKGTSEIPATVDWDDDYKGVTLTTATKLTKGTYTVEIASEEDPTNADSADVVVEDQDVAEIVITADKALTAPAPHKDIAYASYDVFDQYGNSVRSSKSITWAGSCDITGDKATGKLTLKKTTANDEWVYGEQIYVTGVYTKTGATVNKTLTVGTEQALDTLEIVGFVKKGTSTVVQTLPKDFKEGTYYLLFKPLDQEGTQLDKNDLQGNDVTFVTSNPLVIKEVSNTIEEKTVAGETYCAVLVSPGIKVSEGGDVTITAIANRTGNQTEITMTVGEDQVLSSFKLLAPTVTVADGDKKVEIPFEALDEDGKEITNFVTLAKQTTFNTLSFAASDNSTLSLVEQSDGSAKLLWTDSAAPGWNNTSSTDDIDRPISLTAIVVGGTGDNEMIYVSDRRRPDGILSVDMNEVYTENTGITFTAGTFAQYESFQFVDQYGKTIKGTKGTEKKFGDDTGFFWAAANSGHTNGLKTSNSDLKDYVFGVRVTYAGSGKISYVPANNVGQNVYDNNAAQIADKALDKNQAVVTWDGTVAFKTSDEVESAATGEGFKFEIAKNSNSATSWKASDWESASPSKFVETAVVDLSQIKSFAVKSLNKFYVGAVTSTAGAVTGDGKIATAALDELHSDAGDIVLSATGGLTDNPTYQKAVEVTGTYNGKSVDIPAAYYTVEGSKISTAATADVVVRDSNKITKIVEDGLNTQALYDKTTSEGTSKDASDTLKVMLYNINAGFYYNNGVKGAPIFNDALTYAIGATEINDANIDPTKAAIVNALNNTVNTATDGAIEAILIKDGQQIAVGTTARKATADLEKANDNLKTLKAAITALKSDSTVVGDTEDAQHIKLTTLNAAIDALTAAENDIEDLLEDSGVYAPVYDTTSASVVFSDQAPTATTIDGLAESCKLVPDSTRIEIDIDTTGIRKDSNTPITVKDQYGETLAATITFKATNVVPNENGYADNNFTVTGNATTKLVIEGAERGDTFDLVLTAGGATATCAVTVDPDEMSSIVNNDNNYNWLVEHVLEQQRKNGLG